MHNITMRPIATPVVAWSVSLLEILVSSAKAANRSKSRLNCFLWWAQVTIIKFRSGSLQGKGQFWSKKGTGPQ